MIGAEIISADCQESVVVKGEAADRLTVTSSVPQGSLLGPLFFLVYKDLPRVISKGSSIALYADDSKFYRIMNSKEDLTTFQSDIERKYQNGVSLIYKIIMNTKKCTTMRITRKKSPLVGEFYIEGQPLESVNVHKV